MGTFIQIDMPQQPSFAEPLFPLNNDYSASNDFVPSNNGEWYGGQKLTFPPAQTTSHPIAGTETMDPLMTKLFAWENKDTDSFTSLLHHS